MITKPRLLQWVIPYELCNANAVEALKHTCLERGEWFAIERDDLHDAFRIWHIIGEYHK